MKKIIFLISVFLMFFTSARAQAIFEYEYSQMLMSLWRQPSARAEAIGRGNAALTGDAFSSFYNPAASSFINGTAVSYSSLDHNSWESNEETYDYAGAAHNSKKYGAMGFSYLDFYWGEVSYIAQVDPLIVKKHEAHTKLYMLNYSYMVMDNFSAGVNINYFKEGLFPNDSPENFLVDFGLLKKFAIEPDRHNIYASLSWNNILNPAVKIDTGIGGELTEYIPSILHAAGAYEYIYNPSQMDLTPFGFTVCAEYQDVLNAKSYTRWQIGTELSFMEILKARAGYYAMALRTGMPDSYNYNRFTYGFGLNIPMDKLMKNIPLQLSIDYANLPSYYRYDRTEERRNGDYNVLTANLLFIL